MGAIGGICVRLTGCTDRRALVYTVLRKCSTRSVVSGGRVQAWTMRCVVDIGILVIENKSIVS